MTDTNLSHLYFLLDRSGSMTSIRTATQEGFDAFMSEQRKVPGACLVTLAQFDDQYDEVYVDRPVADVPNLDLVPRGSTALLDAIGRMVNTAAERITALPEDERPGSVIVGIMTDGHENASREWTHEQIKALIECQTKVHHWEFMYLGADQDAIEVGARMGIRRERSMTYDRGNTREAFDIVSRKARAYKEGLMAGMSLADASALNDFTDEDRASASK